jgi:hypothetical protein
MNEAAMAAAARTADREDDDAPLDVAGAAQAIERLLDREDAAADVGDPDAARAAPGGQDDEPRLTVRIGGAEREMALSDIVALYQARGGDAAQPADGRETAAAQRAALEAAQSQGVHQARQLDALLPALRQQLQAFAGTDWARVAAEDPALYAQARPAYEALAARLGQAEAMQAELAQRQRRLSHAATTAHVRHLDAERDAFLRSVPELADRGAARREMAALGDYLAKAGYSAQEMDGLVDHRDLILARKAMLYDRLMQGRGQLARTVGALPRMQAPGIAAERGDRGAARRAALMKRLQRTGRTEDAARLIEDLI